MKKLLSALGILVLIGAVVFFGVIPAQIGKRMNATINPPPYTASAQAQELHRQLLIADLHADTLLWSRDPLKQSDWGHVDVPRLIEGNVALQSFTVVTKTPRSMNIESNTPDTDNITLLALAQLWPVSTWNSLLQRALYQAGRLQSVEERSGGKFKLIRNRSDLDAYLAFRKTIDSKITAGILGIEGAQALDGDPANLDRLYDAGFRMIGVAHFFDNEMGGSAHGVNQGGLTEKGREMIRRMENRKVFVDLAHSSPKVIDEVLAIATRPVIVSHSGVKGTCDNTRNLSDEQLKGIAKTGGVVGIGFWETATCGRDARAIARAIRYAINVMGIDHVALGSDYDGAVVEPFDTTGLALITDALLQEGLTEEQIRKVMGENAIRIYRTYLP